MTKSWFYALVAVSVLSACSDPSPIIHESSEKSESSLQIDNCTAINPCSDNNGIKLWYSKSKLVGEQAFQVTIDVPPTARINSAMLSGETMDMGYIPVFFKPLSNTQYQAQAMVGLCTSKMMQWNLTIAIERPELGERNISFPLYIVR
ncbi:hypothetical protein PA25_13840 [Pseudoalteromonas sp. A25]|uniref:hypothetical protein n=1 Tax=Pseudoalteromonas sp. A25 TaxID=116092 RepID=UPI00126095F1|nr:hypothetical protein [Pseudoalteromonas sp. A25]BBN81399.1 hypothetical protein PA25_13840 [Pseudoalteromonas sp. A25]